MMAKPETAVTDAQEFATTADAPFSDITGLMETIQSLYHIRDLDTLLEQVLFEARRLVHADAGTLYLRSGDRLFFSYIQNDTLFKGEEGRTRYVYSSRSLAVDRTSLAGYVASTGDSLLIDDVYDIRSGVTYSFNADFDTKTNYKTRSMLIVPLLTRSRKVVGVLQLINAKDEKGNSIPFSGRDRLFANQFAQNAADAIERARLSREMVLRLVELSALRDPYETGQHAKRVGAYAVELYQAWATYQEVVPLEVQENRQIIRNAAMLHDVGKVAISDTILQKRGRLTKEELKTMRLHTIYGARLFRRLDSPWDQMARDVALNHHERWDGTGYPGHVRDLFAKRVRIGKPKKAEEVPLPARIVSVVDVYDALMSRRAYKAAWAETEVCDYLKRQSGKQFEPILVELFLDMPDIRHSIAQKYSY